MKIINYKTLMNVAVATLFISSYSQASETDDRIESAAKDSYVFTTHLKNDNINVSSKEGVVTLTGTVLNDTHKSLAKQTVENLPSVKSVDDQLLVKGENPSKNSDAWITTKVNTNLMFHRHVSASNTDVSTQNGVVTLKGEAESREQRDLTTEYAKDVDGVKSVKNEMTLSETYPKSKMNKKVKAAKEDIDDASITSQIKVSLFSHRSTSAIDTHVKTDKGVVTLQGIAKNETQRKLVSKLSADVYGVKDVKNKMTLQQSK